MKEKKRIRLIMLNNLTAGTFCLAIFFAFLNSDISILLLSTSFVLAIISFVLKFFWIKLKEIKQRNIDAKDEYLQYLNRTTKFKWRRFISKNEYFCDEKGYYIKRLLNGKAKVTRDGNIIGKQTMSGPFCSWFEISEYEIEMYLK